MKKVKHSKKKVKPGRAKTHNEIKQVVDKPSPLEDLLTKFFNRRALKSFPLLHPFQAYADKPNPFPDVERARAFCLLIESVHTVALTCSNPRFEFGTKEERKEITRLLKKKFKLIPRIFSFLLPRNIRGARLLRYYKRDPEWLVSTIEWIKQRLRKYLKASYRGKRIQKGKDIQQFWEEQFKEPYPRGIYMENRTETTIAVSILAHRAHCSYDRLNKIYIEAKKKAKEYERIKEQIIDF